MEKEQVTIRFYAVNPTEEWPKDSSLNWPEDMLCRTPKDLLDLLDGNPEDAERIYSYILTCHKRVREFLIAKGVNNEHINFSLNRKDFVEKLRKGLKKEEGPLDSEALSQPCVKKIFRLRFGDVICHSFEELVNYLSVQGDNPNCRSIIAANLPNIRRFLEDVNLPDIAMQLPQVINNISDSEVVNRILSCFKLRGVDNSAYRYSDYIALSDYPTIIAKNNGGIRVLFPYRVKKVINDTIPIKVLNNNTSKYIHEDEISLSTKREDWFSVQLEENEDLLLFESRLSLIHNILLDINGLIDENKLARYFVETEIEDLYVTITSRKQIAGYCYCRYDKQKNSFFPTQENAELFKSVSHFVGDVNRKVAWAKTNSGRDVWINSQGQISEDFFCLNKAYSFEEDGYSIALLSSGSLAIVNNQGAYTLIDFLTINVRHHDCQFIVCDKNKKWGVYDFTKKQFIVPCKYKRIDSFNDDIYAYLSFYKLFFKNILTNKKSDSYWGTIEFNEGYGCFMKSVNSSEYWGFIDKDFNESVLFDETRMFSQGYAPVRKGSHWGYISKAVLESRQPVDASVYRYQEARPFKDDYAAIKMNNLWGFLHLSDVGLPISVLEKALSKSIPCLYKEVSDFSNGYAAVKITTVAEGEKCIDRWGFINGNGEIVVAPVYEIVNPSIIDNSYFTGKRDGKWSIFKLDGSEVEGVPAVYEEIGQFVNGIAPAKLGGKWGYIRLNGYPIRIVSDGTNTLFEPIIKKTEKKDTTDDGWSHTDSEPYEWRFPDL